MICCVGDGGLCLIEPAAGGDIRFNADNRFDMGGLRFDIELDGTEHIAVVGNCDGVHIKLFAALEQFIEANRSIEQ